MSDAPKTISLLPDDGWTWMEGRVVHEPNAVEYTRTDHVQTLIAEAVAAEREALADHVSASCFSIPSGNASRSYNAGMRDAIAANRSFTPTAALAALEARDKRVRDEALRECLDIVGGWHDNGNKPGDWAVLKIEAAILALIDADEPTTPPSHG